MPQWPASLPQIPLREGFQVSTPDDIVIRTQMEDGPSVNRRRKLQVWSDIQCSYMLTRTQFATLRFFWRNDLNCGADTFVMPMFNFGTGESSFFEAKWKSPAPIPSEFGPLRVRASLSVSLLDYI